jgi:hypothetical protein
MWREMLGVIHGKGGRRRESEAGRRKKGTGAGNEN